MVPKRHVLSCHNAQFRMSAYLQEVSCWVGQQEVFDKSSEALSKLLQVEVTDKQVERLCHHYGQALEQLFE